MTEEEILKMYDEIKIAKNDICADCKVIVNDLCSPVTIWQVGNFFNADKYKILFVGKNARGSLGDFCDCTKKADELIENPWAYWSYTKAIFNKIYPNSKVNAWERIAFTNIVKCNNSTSVDTTKKEIKKNCILKLQVLKREISILKPNYMVFYTGKDYDKYIQEIFNIKFDTSKRKQIGARQILWNEFSISENDHVTKCLRTAHPERKKKDDFVNSIVEWIKNESDS